MDTALLDAAFRLVSHSITSQEARFHPLATNEARLAELRSQFPQLDARALKEAYARAQRLEELAIEMADADRGPGDGRSGPPLTRLTISERCPGFSDESYEWAVNDGFTLTRK
jgi:hypothetical protein